MNNSRWEIWLDDPRGNRLALLNGARSFSFTRVANSIGDFSISMPADFDHSLARVDSLIEFWRAPVGGSLKWVGVGLARRFDYSGWPATLTIGGPDGIDLLNRRIVAYAAGSAQAAKTDYLDDMIKEIITQNLGSGAVAARDLSSLGLSVAADLSAAPSATCGFSWQNVLELCLRLTDASRQAGTELYFDLEPTLISDSQIGFVFRTFTGQRGADHTYPDGRNPILFGPEWGNLENPSLEYIYDEEINYVYAGGQGEEADREIVEVSDSTRIGASVWNRREGFADARNEPTTAGVTTKGNEVLAAGRPRLHFSGDLLDTERARYGVEWEFGDRVSATYLGRQFDGMIRAVSIQMGDGGQETLTARLEVDG